MRPAFRRGISSGSAPAWPSASTQYQNGTAMKLLKLKVHLHRAQRTRRAASRPEADFLAAYSRVHPTRAASIGITLQRQERAMSLTNLTFLASLVLTASRRTCRRSFMKTLSWRDKALEVLG